MTLEGFFNLNRPLILFLYGQVFFVLGLAIFLQSRRHSRLKLARDLRWLAGFGILHGLHEWGLVFIPIQMEYLTAVWQEVLLILQIWLLAASYVSLVIFGAVLIEPKFRWSKPVMAGLIFIWVFFFGIPRFTLVETVLWADQATLWARYLLGLPGALSSAYGLYLVAQLVEKEHSDRKFFRMLQTAGYALVAYGFFGGLMVSQRPFFPASVINQQALEGWIGLPVEVFRSLAGLVLAISIIRALEIFEIEVDRLIEEMEVEAIRSAERDRIGQEIHDGAMQGVYSVGLILNSLTPLIAQLPAATKRLFQANQVLEKVVLDLRRYMTSLRNPVSAKPFKEALEELVAEPHFSTLLNIHLELTETPALDPVQTSRLVSVTQEILANVVRHAGATAVTIRLYPDSHAYILTITDNGRGFDQTEIKPGFGLQSIKDHAQLLGADLEIKTAPGKGTAYKMRCPRKELV